MARACTGASGNRAVAFGVSVSASAEGSSWLLPAATIRRSTGPLETQSVGRAPHRHGARPGIGKNRKSRQHWWLCRVDGRQIEHDGLHGAERGRDRGRGDARCRRRHGKHFRVDDAGLDRARLRIDDFSDLVQPPSSVHREADDIARFETQMRHAERERHAFAPRP
jgi:hypothetical protein